MAAPSHGTGAIWRTLRADPTPRTAAELAQTCGVTRGTVDQLLRHMSRAGFVLRVPGKPARHHLSPRAPAQAPSFNRAGEPIAPREPATAPLWRAMRVLSKRGPFDVPMLAIVAQVSPTYAHNFVNRLRRAGYLRLIAQSWRAEIARFRLVRDTGPIAPRIDVRRGRRVLIDGNTGERIDISPARVSLRSKPALAPVDGGVS